MKNRTFEDHPSELALELWASGETAPEERAAIEGHLRGCEACKAREASWRALFQALATLPSVEPSASFDLRVMARVRLPVAQPALVAAHRGLVRRLRPLALGAAAVWTGTVVVGAAWLQSQLDVPLAALLARLVDRGGELLLAGAIKLGALIELSGIATLLERVATGVPGSLMAAAAGLMTVLSGLAIWTLYRVTALPSEVRNHA